jgi:hypothetical protein
MSPEGNALELLGSPSAYRGRRRAHNHGDASDGYQFDDGYRKSPAPKDRTLLILVLAALAEFALATLGVNLVHLGCITRTSVLEHLPQSKRSSAVRSPIFFGPLRSGTTKSIAPVPSGKRASG